MLAGVSVDELQQPALPSNKIIILKKQDCHSIVILNTVKVIQQCALCSTMTDKDKCKSLVIKLI